eukprot:92107-Prorocentrum_minimum.AAC.1
MKGFSYPVFEGNELEHGPDVPLTAVVLLPKLFLGTSRWRTFVAHVLGRLKRLLAAWASVRKLAIRMRQVRYRSTRLFAFPVVKRSRSPTM